MACFSFYYRSIIVFTFLTLGAFMISLLLWIGLQAEKKDVVGAQEQVQSYL